MRSALRNYGIISSNNSEYQTHGKSKVIHAIRSPLHSHGTKSKINIVTQARLLGFVAHYAFVVLVLLPVVLRQTVLQNRIRFKTIW
jgi:hypothetical protein